MRKTKDYIKYSPTLFGLVCNYVNIHETVKKFIKE